MNSTFLGLLDTHVEKIKKTASSSGGGKDANDILFKTIKLLLDELDYSDKALAAYDEMEMRKLFTSFGRISQTTCDFYKASKGHLDPEALNGTIGKDIEATTKEIDNKNKLLESIEKNNADLLKRKEELNQINEKYVKKTEEVSKLKKIEETVSDDVLTKLDRKKAELNGIIDKNQKIKTELDRSIKDLENTRQSLSDSTARANAEKKEIEENIIKTIDAKLDTIREIYTKKQKDINGIKVEIEKFKSQYKQLCDVFKNAQSQYDFYNLYLGENSSIVKKMKDYGIPKTDVFLTKIESLRDSIKSELEQFDKLIRGVIGEFEKARDEIDKGVEK